MEVANKKIGLILLLVVFALLSLFIIAMSEGVPDDNNGTNLTETERYFVDKITAQTLERIDAQPIEGLEKSMYMQAYPGLEEDDFTGVETLGDTNEANVQTSADAMITNRGLATLLENTAHRLDLAVESEADIDALLVTISRDPSIDENRDINATSSASGDLATSCEAAGGNWLAEYDECEYISSSWCSENEGTFAECTSACRHDPEAEICTMQCVPVCQLNQ